MRLASKFHFSYATIPARPHARPRHKRNPFQPEASAAPGHLYVPMDEPTSASAQVIPSPSAQYHQFPEVRGKGIEEKQPTALCSPHPLHLAWDDDSSTDHGYENPYYSRTLMDSLWLPRDPLGTLDLDDTVDLRISITSEPGAGKLGTWNEEDFIGSTITLPSALSSFSDVGDDISVYTTAVRQLNGDELINLPAGIASRVEHIDKEQNVEDTDTLRRPSIMQRRTSSSNSSRATSPHLNLRRPSTFDAGPSSGFRSFSLGAESPSSAGISPTSATSTHVSSDRRRRNRASTMDAGSSLRPVIVIPISRHQASKSLLSVVEQQPSSAHSSKFLSSPRASSIISTRDAVVGEVIVEEQEATQERIRQEEVEAEKAKQPRSLFTAWMFARPKDAEAVPP